MEVEVAPRENCCRFGETDQGHREDFVGADSVRSLSRCE
jgi:hypothetical protein